MAGSSSPLFGIRYTQREEPHVPGRFSLYIERVPGGAGSELIEIINLLPACSNKLGA